MADSDAQAMLAQPRKSYILYGVEPPHDFADGAAALQALRAAEQVVAFSAYASDALREVADVILPIALLPEIDATLVNVDGLAQGVSAGAKAPGRGASRAGRCCARWAARCSCRVSSSTTSPVARWHQRSTRAC